jgi:hypothetical protein
MSRLALAAWAKRPSRMRAAVQRAALKHGAWSRERSALATLIAAALDFAEALDVSGPPQRRDAEKS